MSDALFAKVGKLQCALDDKTTEYTKLLLVFAAVIKGDIDASRVLVNLTDGTYLWAAPDTRPGMPAQINDVPVCVMAPERPKPDSQVLFDKDGAEMMVSGIGLKVEPIKVVRPAGLNGEIPELVCKPRLE